VAINRADLEAIKAAIIGAINSAAGASGTGATTGDAESIDRLNKYLAGLKETSDALERQEQVANAMADSEKKLAEQRRIGIDQAKNEIEIAQITLQINQKNNLYTAAQEEAVKKLIAKKQKYIEETEKAIKADEEKIASTESLTNTMKGLVQVYETHSLVNTQNIVSMVKQVRQLGFQKAAIGALKGVALGLIDTMISLAFKTDEAAKSFMASTGASEEMAKAISGDIQSMAFYGVQVDEVYKAHTALRGEMSEFSLMSQQNQRDIANTGALLEKQGVSLSDYAKATQLGVKAFGLSGAEAAAVSRDLNSLAMQIGVTPQQMAQDFVTAGDEVAAFGASGVDAFKDLAVVSKTTGLQIEKLIAISDGFDTFEDAATSAGRLNAALGGNFVNAMDLMMAKEPAKRFEMIRDAVLRTGKTFDDMDYFEKKFYVNAIEGIESTADLALLMSGNFDTLAGATEKSSDEILALQERTKSIQNIQERFKSLLASMIPVVTPLIDVFEGLVKQLEGNEEAIQRFGKGIVNVTKFVVFLIPHLDKILYGFIALTVLKGAGALGMWVAQLVVLGKGAPIASTGMSKLVGPTLAFGAAIGMAAAGIGFAANGLANLAEAFSSLSAEQISGLNEAINALMRTMLIFGVALVGLAVAGKAAFAPMLGLGAAILLIGGGIGVAAAGIGYMGEGLASMFSAMNAENTALFTGFVSTLVLGSAGFAAAGLGLAAMASGISSVASALNEINTDTIKELSKMGGVDVGVTSDGVATNIQTIMDAINGVDTLKLGAAAVMVTAAAANNNATTAPAPQMAAQNQKDTNIDVKVYIDGKQMASEAVVAVDNEFKRRIQGKGTTVII